MQIDFDPTTTDFTSTGDAITAIANRTRIISALLTSAEEKIATVPETEINGRVQTVSSLLQAIEDELTVMIAQLDKAEMLALSEMN